MRNLKVLALVFLALPMLAACEALVAADKLTETTVQGVCAQPERLRRVQREKAADWGLWVKCVPAGTSYGAHQLVKADR